jgi:hypothetical protein
VCEREALEEIEQFERNPGCNGLLPVNAVAFRKIIQAQRTEKPPSDTRENKKPSAHRRRLQIINLSRRTIIHGKKAKRGG